MDAQGERGMLRRLIDLLFRLVRQQPTDDGSNGDSGKAVPMGDTSGDETRKESTATRDAFLSDSEVDLLVARCQAQLPPLSSWAAAGGYPNSLSMAILDAIWAMGARYTITRGVITRYVSSRRARSAEPFNDSVSDLLAEYERQGGVNGFIEEIGTRNRVSTQPGAEFKGVVVHQAALAFRELGVDTAQQFIEAQGTSLGQALEAQWRSLPGQGSGISWRYLRMLVGLEDVKPDRMVLRFLESSLNRSVDIEEAVELVRAAAGRLGVGVRALDHEIWEFQSGTAGAHDPVTRSDLLRETAHAFLGSAFGGLRKAGVIPTSRHELDWYLQVGRDYDAGDASGPETDALRLALEKLYPDRFAEPLRRKDPEFPNAYIYDLLEGAVARCSRFDEYDPDGPEAVASIDELIAALESDRRTVYACRAMSNLTTVSDEPVEIGEVTVHPEVEEFGGLVRFAVSLVPAGPRAFNRQDPRPYDPPHALLVASDDVERGKSSWPRVSSALRKIEHFIFLARLLKTGTQQSMWELGGGSTLVSGVSPRYRVFDGAGMPKITMTRTLAIRPEDAPAFEALSRLLDEAVVEREGMVSTSFDLSADLFHRSFEPGTWAERITDLATALEAALIGGDRDHLRINQKLQDRSSKLLSTQDDPAAAIEKDVKTLYGLRSSLVHGSSISDVELRRVLETVSTVPTGEMFGVILDFAVDRLRDIVRRAFLARLCLSRAPTPLWPLKGGIDVGAALADPATASHWRKQWQELLKAVGAGEAAQQALPAADPLREPQDL
ncbi:MAG TPA: hypothetical protein VHB02_15470 [Acidimicrobiales bacterium]|nr:hypothetical protein [Acidimicrobiales bacterium]